MINDLSAGGVALKGGSAGKVGMLKSNRRMKRKATPAEANARRQEKRRSDDYVLCPICLCRTWGPGRSTNCVEHIKKRVCEMKLGKIAVLTDQKGDESVCGGFWIHLNDTVTVASISPGAERRSRRNYWYPKTFSNALDAEIEWESILFNVRASTMSSLSILVGEDAVTKITEAQKKGIWEFRTDQPPHTNADGSVDALRITQSLDAIVEAIEIDDFFPSLSSPELIREVESEILDLDPSFTNDDFDPWDTSAPVPSEIPIEAILQDNCTFSCPER